MESFTLGPTPKIDFSCSATHLKRLQRDLELQHAISISDVRASGPRKAVVRTVEVESAISFFDERASEPQLPDLRTVIFELRFLP
jgi:hypothetical protein